MKLHDYQEIAVEAAIGIVGRGASEIIVMPPGSGKSVVAAAIVKTVHQWNKRVLILSHVQEIIEQDVGAIRAMLPDVSVGVACAGLGPITLTQRITVASIQSVYHRTGLRWLYDVVIIDEAHLISRNNVSMYRHLIDAIQRDRRKPVPIIGLTATPYRLDSGYLHRGDGALFSRIAYEVPLGPLVDQKYLAPLTTGNVKSINFDRLPKGDEGDYKVSVYTDTTDDTEWLAESERAVAHTITAAAKRARWLVYCCTIKHAEAVTQLLAKAGIQARCLHSMMERKERRETVAAFRSGQFRALVNVNILATGFDVPDVDCVVLLRPTLSTGAYVQMLGRGMRTSPGKTDCLVLDFAGNVARHGPIADIVPKVMRFDVKDRVGIVRPCPTCGLDVKPFTRQCGACGHLFASIDAANPAQGDVMFMGETQGKRRKGKKSLVPIPPLADSELLATEEVAWLLGTTVQYIKQMRTLKMGPAYRRTGGMTNLGWRQVVYDTAVVHRWLARLEVVTTGKNGRTYRMTPEGMATLRQENARRKKRDPEGTQDGK